MRILKKALLYDIANMAFTIADCGDPANHSLHRVRDICEDGNIDRVSRILALAYANLLAALLPILKAPPKPGRDSDSHKKDCPGDEETERSRDYYFFFRKNGAMKFILTKERELKIKEFAHEYMVCMVLADWLGVTLPEAADVWKFRAKGALEALKEESANMVRSASGASLKRRLSPF